MHTTVQLFFLKLFAHRCIKCRRPAHRNITGDYLCWRHFGDGYKGYSVPIQDWAWEIDPPTWERSERK